MQIDFSIISENLARTYGDTECIVNVERNRRYTFREYHLLTNRITNMMHERLDLRGGDMWLSILYNDSLSLLSYFTAFKGESCACFTNANDSMETQANQLDLVKPKVVFIEADLLPTHYAFLQDYNVTIVSMDPPAPEYADVLYFWDLLEGVSDDNPNVLLNDREDIKVVRFTGGTTGLPKGIMYTIDNWMATRDLHFAMVDPIPTRGSRMLHLGPISHASGIVFIPILFKGGCNLTMNDRSLAVWCRTVEAEKVTSSLMVPAMLYMLLEAPEAHDTDLSTLETIFYGASPVSPAKMKQLQERFDNIFVQLYGSSEHVGCVSGLSKADHLPLADGSETHLASAGRATPGVELLIMGKDGQPVATGEDGEIWMRSRAIIPGYLHAPEKTAEEFCNGYWKSGDYGRIDENGFLYVLDRVKDTIVCNGCNVYPNQVEAQITAHPAVIMAAAVGIPCPERGEAVHVEVMLRVGEEVEVDELLAFAADRLPANDRPKTISIAPQLPLSPVGKVLRRTVREDCRKRFSSA
jgi:acyl-CoA synthetase (AMP-forming)/AMP-acid ligase II